MPEKTEAKKTAIVSSPAIMTISSVRFIRNDGSIFSKNLFERVKHASEIMSKMQERQNGFSDFLFSLPLRKKRKDAPSDKNEITIQKETHSERGIYILKKERISGEKAKDIEIIMRFFILKSSEREEKKFRNMTTIRG